MDAYVGFDSAWTDNPEAPGAICAVCMTAGRPPGFYAPRLASFDQALRFIRKVRSDNGNTLIALDQPTVVPNLTGMRQVDRTAASLIGWLGGGVPANRGRIGMFCDASDWGQEPAIPEDIQHAIDTVVTLADAFHQRRFVAVQETEDIKQRTVLTLREKLRMHTQIVRNWGYFSRVVGISSELYEPLDEQLRQHHGFGATDLIKVGRGLVEMLEESASTSASEFFAKSLDDHRRLVRQYYKLYPHVVGDPKEFLQSIPSFATLEMVRSRLIKGAEGSQKLSRYMTRAQRRTAQAPSMLHRSGNSPLHPS